MSRTHCRPVALAAALAIFTASAASAADRQPLTVPTTPDSVRVLLFKEGVQYAYPRWSADGSQILYQSNESGSWQIYVMNADGTGIRQLTDHDSNNNYPDWSPDNTRLAYVSDRTGNEEVYVMSMDGTGLANLSNNPGRDIHPYWSPDSRFILFNSNRDNPSSLSVFRIAADGSNLTRLSATNDVETCARLSPDGSRIVLLRAFEQINDEVFLTDPEGANPINLTASNAAEGWPCWTPDSRRVVYSSDSDGPFRLFIINADGTGRRPLSHAPAPWNDARASVSTDGRQVVINRQTGGTIAICDMTLN